MAQTCRDQEITILPTQGEVSLQFNGKTIARSTNALNLFEANYPPVIYIPLADVDQSFLKSSNHTSYCPYKGDAAYYSLRDGKKHAENAVWYYPDPCPLVAKIKNHVAFWGDDIEYVSDGTVT